jgi:hypothetical protein
MLFFLMNIDMQLANEGAYCGAGLKDALNP